MRLEASDPDLETLVTRIERGDIDLQPAFQRGEVWGKAKKQRLVDSILRGWHVPPIHVIELPGSRKLEVLDGQQRLTAVRDFVRGEIPVDGHIEPLEPSITELDGLKFRDIPDSWKRKFNQFTIRVFRIVDYKTEEPGELFFRLNQPTSLTAAEQRNAFFGPVRVQIKSLVDLLDKQGINKELLGFSNSRMAYDDVIARVALTVEKNTIAEKVTANSLIDLYRADRSLSSSTVERISRAIALVSDAREKIIGHVHFNKATAYSWLIFAIKGLAIDRERFTGSLFGDYANAFEEARLMSDLLDPNEIVDWHGYRVRMLDVYDNRSASRVADVSSVVLRDIAIWLEFETFLDSSKDYKFPIERAGVSLLHSALRSIGSPFDEDMLARRTLESGWGRIV